MDSTTFPKGWELTKNEIWPQHPLFASFIKDTFRLIESEVPQSVRSRIPKHVHFIMTEQPTITLNERVYYQGQIHNRQINGLGLQRVIDEGGMDQIFEGFFINGHIAWGRWWYMDDDTVYYFQGYFYSGKPHDKDAHEYDSGGQLYQFKDIKVPQVGVWNYYSQEKVLMNQGLVIFGMRQGPWKSFDENGNVMESGNYDQGQRVGEWITYHQNGQIEQIIQRIINRTKGIFCEERRHGTWIFYSPDGKLECLKEYEMGMVLEESYPD